MQTALDLIFLKSGSVKNRVVRQEIYSRSRFFRLTDNRQEPFLMGQLSFASIGFDLSITAAFLLLTIHTLDSRRYRGA